MDRIRRPNVVVLPDEALVRSAAEPASPIQFTHVLRTAQPFYAMASGGELESTLLDEGRQRLQADGNFEVGAEVALIDSGNGVYCTVMDGRGRLVMTACAGLARLEV
ncbi:MAG: hypothetical protein QM784_34990 [Polyangiaceae bacterium]